MTRGPTPPLALAISIAVACTISLAILCLFIAGVIVWATEL
ncbi:hypothetical protein [Sphingomonas sp. MS122]